MRNAKRGRGVYVGVVAVLGLALSACGGSVGGSLAGASAATSALPTESAVASESVTAASSPASSQGSTPAQSTSSGSGTTTGSGSTGSSTPTANAGTLTINWMPPTENVDGSTLTNLAGYNIHYGTSSGKYTQKISVSNPGIASYVVSSLTPGTYYFAVAAVNSVGTEGPLSAEVSATVN